MPVAPAASFVSPLMVVKVLVSMVAEWFAEKVWFE
jgi:hypothetical protein